MSDAEDRISINTLRNLFSYDEKEGGLLWKNRDRSLFTSDRIHRSWNGKNAGKRAGHKNPSTYRYVRIFGRNVAVHRAVWAMHNGSWPKGVIDHIDGRPGNNKIENLRDVTRKENQRNQRLRATSKSGVCGVSFNTKSQKWVVQISISCGQRFIGSYDTKDEAAIAASAAYRAAGYHDNHGGQNATK